MKHRQGEVRKKVIIRPVPCLMEPRPSQAQVIAITFLHRMFMMMLQVLQPKLVAISSLNLHNDFSSLVVAITKDL
jgi:hypothetical protein